MAELHPTTPRCGVRQTLVRLVFGAVCWTFVVAAPTVRAEAPAEALTLPAGAVARFGSLAFRHAEPVRALAWSPNGKTVVTGGEDGVLRVWQVATGTMVRELRGHEAAIANVVVSPNGKLLAANDQNKLLRVWDVSTGKELWKVEKAPPGQPLAFSGDSQTVIGRGSDEEAPRLKVWDATTGKERGELPPGGQPMTRLALSTSGKTLAFVESLQAAAVEGPALANIQIFDVASHRRLRRFEVSVDVAALALSADGRLLALLPTGGRTVSIRETATGKEWRKLRSPRSGIARLVFSPDGRFLAGQGADGNLRLWNLDTGELDRTLRVEEKDPEAIVPPMVFGVPVPAEPADPCPGPEAPETGNLHLPPVAFSPDGKLLAAAGSDRVLRFYETATGREHRPVDGHRWGVSAVALSPDGKWLASGGVDTTVRLWDVAQKREVAQLRGHSRPVTELAFSADGKLLVSGSAKDADVHVWEVASGKEVAVLTRPASEETLVANSLALSADGSRAAVGAAVLKGKKIVRWVSIWDVHSSKELRKIKLDEVGLPNPAMFGPFGVPLGGNAFGNLGGQFGLQGGMGGFLGVPKAGRGLLPPWLEHLPTYGPPALALSPDGQTVAAGTVDTVSLFDVNTGKRLREFTEVLPMIFQLAISPDGKSVAVSGSEEAVIAPFLPMPGAPLNPGVEPENDAKEPKTSGVVVLLDVGERRERARLEQELVTTLAFSPDNRTLAVGDDGQRLQLWDVREGRRSGGFAGHLGMIQSVAFSRDGKTLATGSKDTTVLIWDAAEGLKKPTALAPRASDDALWAALEDAEVGPAREAMRRLSNAPEQAISLLSKRLRPVSADDPRVKRVDQLVADLDSPQFDVREKAGKELAVLGEFAGTALQKALEGQPGLDTRQRLEEILGRVEEVEATGEFLAALRGIEVLERIGSPEARRLLRALAAGSPVARRTLEARDALDRLAHRDQSEP